MKEKLLDAVGKGLRIGLAIAGGYTGAYICTRKVCCHETDDPVMKIVRGVAGGLIGAHLGSNTAVTMDLEMKAFFNKDKEAKEKTDE